MKFDRSGSQIIIDYAHHKAHHGLLYNCPDTATNIQAATPKLWRISVPAGCYPHTFIEIGLDGGAKVELYEGPTLTGNGTSISAFNNDRNSTKTPNLLFFKDPTVSANGTLIGIWSAGSGNKMGGSASNSTEYILKVSTEYLIKVTVDTNGTNATFHTEFYEAQQS